MYQLKRLKYSRAAKIRIYRQNVVGDHHVDPRYAKLAQERILKKNRMNGIKVKKTTTFGRRIPRSDKKRSIYSSGGDAISKT